MKEAGKLPEELTRNLLDARLTELRMLFYIGKDLLRWAEQCVESAAKSSKPKPDVKLQSFFHLLIDDTPAAVKEKLRLWGVLDYQAIFARGVALNIIFTQPPDPGLLSSAFLEEYHRLIHGLYSAFNREAFARISSAQYHFEIFSSGEYASRLEQEWER